MEENFKQISNVEFRQMLADRIKALGDPTRIYLLYYLLQGERSVNELAELTKKNQATVSKQLSILHQHGYLVRRKEGTQAIYSTQGEELKTICQFMCESLRSHLDQISKVSGSFS